MTSDALDELALVVLNQVDAIYGRLDREFPEDQQRLARALAERAYLHHPINRSERVIAAGSIYLASSVHGPKIAQATVADAAGIRVRGVSVTYKEIGKREGLIRPAQPVDAGHRGILDQLLDSMGVQRYA